MAIESASAQLLMSHSTNSGVALCLKPSNRRLKLSAASLKNPLRETHISTVFEVEFRWPKRAVIIFNLRAARPVLRLPAGCCPQLSYQVSCMNANKSKR